MLYKRKNAARVRIQNRSIEYRYFFLTIINCIQIRWLIIVRKHLELLQPLFLLFPFCLASWRGERIANDKPAEIHLELKALYENYKRRSESQQELSPDRK